MAWAIRHGLPVPIGLPLAILLPLLVDQVPARLDARARGYACIIDTPPALEYLQKLTAQHACIVRAAAAHPCAELDYAAQLGHRALWSIATIITAPDRTPDTTCRWLALESLLAHLACQADHLTPTRNAPDTPTDTPTATADPEPRR
ncbi:hypothetical protein AB0I66_00130 [Streptomyces sp. NPDC050439]|uniref:hypothetical protein n=1 Tax=unclassified Streptomyces TaxID=2593676 RepID=UPI00344120C0